LRNREYTIDPLAVERTASKARWMRVAYFDCIAGITGDHHCAFAGCEPVEVGVLVGTEKS